MNILIIEDEAKTAKELKIMIEQLDKNLSVVNVIASVKAAIQWLKTSPPPQLIFSDIQLSDGLSFDIFHAVQSPCPVVFCTAFDHYAIQAFDVNGIDYLLKPIDENKLARSLDKYRQLRRQLANNTAAVTDQLEALLAQLRAKDYKANLLVFKNEKIIPVPVKDIAFIHSAGGVVKAYTKSNQAYFIQEVLDEMEPQLDPRRFFRANRQFIVNRDAVLMAEHYFNRRLILKLSIEVPEQIIISKVKSPELLNWLTREFFGS